MDSAFEEQVVIRQRDEFDGPLFYWPLPSDTAIRYVAVAAFVLGTIISVLGLVAGIQNLIAGRAPIQFVGFAAFALVTGLFSLGLWASLRLRPESVLLGHGHLVYDRGWNVASNIWLYRVVTGTQPLFSKPITVPKDKIAGFSLEEAGRQHQLVFDHAGGRIEIGWVLSERDREWLFRVLEDWLAS